MQSDTSLWKISQVENIKFFRKIKMHYLVIYILILKFFHSWIYLLKLENYEYFLYISIVYLFRIYLLLLNEKNKIKK